ncbi:MAG: pilin [Gammaproteobacteria bacterium]|nr:pilin [Gammaproteobacteria bacterium]
MRKTQGFTLIELMIVLAIVAILSIFAVPAYQNYLARTQVTEGLSLATAAKTAITAYDGSATKLSNDLVNYTSANSRYVNDIKISGTATTPVITITYSKNAASGVNGHSVTLQADNSTGNTVWFCSSDIERNKLPSICSSDEK